MQTREFFARRSANVKHARSEAVPSTEAGQSGQSLSESPQGSPQFVQEHLIAVRRAVDYWGLRQEQILSHILAEVSGGHPDAVGQATPAGALPLVACTQTYEPTEDRVSLATTCITKAESHRSEGATVANQEGTGAEEARVSKGSRHSLILALMQDESDAEAWARKWQRQIARLRAARCCGVPAKGEYTECQKWLSHVVETKIFEAVCALVILANCFYMWLNTNRALHRALYDNDLSSQGERGGLLFALFYVVEWILRVSLHHFHYFLGVDWRWNLLDTVLVVLAVQEWCSFLLSGGEEVNNNFTFVRIVRVVKILKAFRIVRLLRVFRELRLMLSLVLGCARSMSWAILLIGMVSFLFGISFAQASLYYLATQDDPIKTGATYEGILEHWSSVGTAMNALFMAATGGENWRDMAVTLWEMDLAFYIAFLLYILFFLIVVFNTLTGVFMDATTQNASQDQQVIIMEELRKKNTYVKRFREIWAGIDDDLSGDISLEELAFHMEDPSLQAFMSNLEIDICDVVQFFDALSNDGEHRVDVETFVDGCLKLKGWARSVDLFGLIQSSRKALLQQETLTRKCVREVQQLRREIQVGQKRSQLPSSQSPEPEQAAEFLSV